VKLYGRHGAEKGWNFLTGDQVAIQRIARETGFHFAYDRETNEFAHPSGVIVLTPEGKVPRYLFGVNFSPTELREAILAAAKNQNGSVIQRLMLVCYHYNPITGKYGTFVMSILRVSAAATVAIVALSIFLLSRQKSRTQT
jgi:protein SCO1